MTKAKALKRKVFVSYVRDNYLQIDKLCKAFIENDIEYWLDRKDIDPGKFWKDSIKAAINNGAYFLACFSKEYNEREETFMNEELLESVEILRHQFNNEVQHLGQQEGSCYPKCLWENTTST